MKNIKKVNQFRRKLISKTLFIFLVGMVLFMQNITGVYAAEANALDVLYPGHMLPAASFQGEFSDNILKSLKTLSSAEALCKLNVLRGSNGSLLLDQTATRAEGATMLVRLLGAEPEALSGNHTHPFTDVPAWASPYIGYLYQKGLTNGIGNNMYGSALAINEKSYLTFLLRSLGYSDTNGEDFTWNTVEQAAMRTGLLVSEESSESEFPFLRSRLAELSWRAMFLNHKLHNQYLITFLYNQRFITADNLEILLNTQGAPIINQWFAVLPQIENEFREHTEKIEIEITSTMADHELQEYLANILERAQLETGVFIKGYSTELWQEGEDYALCLFPRYVNNIQEDNSLFDWIDQIHSSIVKPEMTDYEKEKVIHDFLVTSIQYDTSPDIPDSSYHAFGALTTMKAVCNGYAELMALLMNKAGIPCRIVTGTGDGIDHAWNMVYIAGEPYHVDVTWDDPVTNFETNTPRYDYFNLTDEEMRKGHIWVEENYSICTATAENYFIKENAIAANEFELKEAIRTAVQNKKSGCMLKLQGFYVTGEDVDDIIHVINEETGYPLSAYMYSYNEDSQVIQFDTFEYVH